MCTYHFLFLTTLIRSKMTSKTLIVHTFSQHDETCEVVNTIEELTLKLSGLKQYTLLAKGWANGRSGRSGSLSFYRKGEGYLTQFLAWWAGVKHRTVAEDVFNFILIPCDHAFCIVTTLEPKPLLVVETDQHKYHILGRVSALSEEVRRELTGEYFYLYEIKNGYSMTRFTDVQKLEDRILQLSVDFSKDL